MIPLSVVAVMDASSSFQIVDAPNFALKPDRRDPIPEPIGHRAIRKKTATATSAVPNHGGGRDQHSRGVVVVVQDRALTWNAQAADTSAA
jgi:hypothetical protein